MYNVTSYMEFHPGGEDELMRGVGTDATDLFNEVRAAKINTDLCIDQHLFSSTLISA